MRCHPVYAPLMEMIAGLMGKPALNADDPAATIGARRQLEARAHHDVWNRVPEITAPTFVIGGRYDGQAPPANLEHLTSALPDSRMQLFEGGHLFLLQDKAAWPAVVDFLREEPSASDPILGS